MKIVYNGRRISEGVLLCKFVVYRYYLGAQKGQQSQLQKIKVVLSKLVREEILKKVLYCLKKRKRKTKIIFAY